MKEVLLDIISLWLPVRHLRVLDVHDSDLRVLDIHHGDLGRLEDLLQRLPLVRPVYPSHHGS